ncbi:MAG: hypothetical protein ACREO5_06280 [Candidatus Binatia bacterium]
MSSHPIWEAAALVLGFQAAGYAWRMSEESRVSHAGDVTWLPVADMVNLSSIGASVFGVYVAPSAGYRLLMPAVNWFGLSLLLFLGHLVCVAAHYELFDIKHPRTMRYFPLQERIAVASVVIAAVAYVVVVVGGL